MSQSSFVEIRVDGQFRLLDMSRVRCVYQMSDCVFVTYYGNELNEIISSSNPEGVYNQIKGALIETKDE